MLSKFLEAWQWESEILRCCGAQQVRSPAPQDVQQAQEGSQTFGGAHLNTVESKCERGGRGISLKALFKRRF
jgi:hypothetical protein